MTSRASLADFKAGVSKPNGMSAKTYQAKLRQLFSDNRSISDINDLRMSRGEWKWIADEALPLSKYLSSLRLSKIRVRFPFNNATPDCWLTMAGTHIGIEITVAKARERYHLKRELVTNGIGPGFLGVSESAPEESFRMASSRGRAMFTINQALDGVIDGLNHAISRKMSPKYNGLTLLIATPNLSIIFDRLTGIPEQIDTLLIRSPFESIYVVPDSGHGVASYKLK